MSSGTAREDPLLRVSGLCRSFTVMGEPVTVLDGCFLEVARGEVVAIVGRSGSGKTTLLTVLGLLDRADAGEHVFDGVDVTCRRDGRLARLRNERIGFVFQRFHLLERRTALANVCVPMVLGGVGARRRRAIARELLEALGLGDRLRFRPHRLSGGEQQRVALARALARDPALILADEPTGALDSAGSTMVMDRLLYHARDRGAAVVVVTNDHDVAVRADRSVLLADGRMDDLSTTVPPG